MDKENITAGDEKIKNIDNFSFQVCFIPAALRTVIVIRHYHPSKLFQFDLKKDRREQTGCLW